MTTIIIGAGLAGLVAASELIAAGKHVTIVDQESETGFGGQAWWSFGGLFLIDSPEQRRMGVKDSLELAEQDWAGTAGFDRDEDAWPRRWAQAYLRFAAAEKRDWLRGLGVKFFPVVGWAERGGYTATGHGNSVPRFHIVWGTGPGLLDPFEKAVRAAVGSGDAVLKFRHRVDELVVESGRVVGVRGSVLRGDDAARGAASTREVVDEFQLRGSAVAASAATTTWCASTGRPGWARRLPICSPACQPTSTDGCSPSVRRPAPG